MSTMVYTLHIAYEGLESKIWRQIEVSSSTTLEKLGYAIVAMFVGEAQHEFGFTVSDKEYGFPDEDDDDSMLDMTATKLSQLALTIGCKFTMTYDYGIMQTFLIELTAISDMAKGQGGHYPLLLDGAGCRIIDDMPCYELAELVRQIDENGKTDTPVLLDKFSPPWDYHNDMMDFQKQYFKGLIGAIKRQYERYFNGDDDEDFDGCFDEDNDE